MDDDGAAAAQAGLAEIARQYCRYLVERDALLLRLKNETSSLSLAVPYDEMRECEVLVLASILKNMHDLAATARELRPNLHVALLPFWSEEVLGLVGSTNRGPRLRVCHNLGSICLDFWFRNKDTFLCACGERFLAASSGDGITNVYCLESGEERGVFFGISQIAFIRDRIVFFSHRDQCCNMYKLSRGEEPVLIGSHACNTGRGNFICADDERVAQIRIASGVVFVTWLSCEMQSIHDCMLPFVLQEHEFAERVALANGKLVLFLWATGRTRLVSEAGQELAATHRRFCAWRNRVYEVHEHDDRQGNDESLFRQVVL